MTVTSKHPNLVSYIFDQICFFDINPRTSAIRNIQSKYELKFWDEEEYVYSLSTVYNVNITSWGWARPSSASIGTKIEYCENLALEWKFINMLKIHHCDENSSFWWKFDIVLKFHLDYGNSSLWWKFIIMMENHHCDENS